MIVYGPVPSRRLGRSLGVNHVPPKTCTYSCVYCQLGRTDNMLCKRRGFYRPDEITEQVEERVKSTGKRIDYVSFVPDGEPTLDVNLGMEIEAVKSLSVKAAVISNSSLLWMEDVRSDLMEADWVSLKVDAITEETLRRVDRPHGRLRLDEILDGMRAFRRVFRGELTTETMLVKGINDSDEETIRIADYLEELQPDKAYLAVPTRPPAEDWVEPPDEEALNRAYQVFCERLDDVEYLIGYEGNAFASTGDAREDLLSITSVHPMREEAVRKLLFRAKSDWGTVKGLIDEGNLVELLYGENKFYMRKLPGRI